MGGGVSNIISTFEGTEAVPVRPGWKGGKALESEQVGQVLRDCCAEVTSRRTPLNHGLQDT
jgi:hypothetical protein